MVRYDAAYVNYSCAKSRRPGPVAAKKPDQTVSGRELELLDGLLPGLYALATGKPLVEGGVMPAMDPAMVDRVIKVLELRLKYKQASAPAPRKGPSWGEARPLGGDTATVTD